MFMFDVETLDIESTAVVLSAALVHFTPEDNYQSLLDKCLFVKFNSKDQIERHKRTVGQSTLDWWKDQHPHVRAQSFDPTSGDLTAEEGIEKLHEYIAEHGGNQQLCWARGSLDQMVIDSLCHRVDLEPMFRYNYWRDVRTAVDCLTGSQNGYCKVDHPDFEPHQVIKHHPVHDCALDAMQLMFGKV